MPFSALYLLLVPISQSALEEIARAEQTRLNTCIEVSQTNPEEAYEDSLAWLGQGNRPAARYCNALALLGLEEFEEAAIRLEALATAPDAVSIEDRTLYLTQAGNAWLTANYPDAALVAFSDALKLQTQDVDLYKDRAATYLALGRWVEAVDDLNATLALVPTDAEALGMRARAHLETENLPAAQADLQAALNQDPRDINLLVLRGEVREAVRLSRLN